MQREPMSAQARIPAHVTSAAVLSLLLAALGSSAALAAEPEACSLTVEPEAAAAGAQFTLSGAGYSPTQLTLEADSGRRTTIELELEGADPFEIPVASHVGDEGAWTATVHAGPGCQASASFLVTLRSTGQDASLASLSGSVTAGGGAGASALPLLLYGLVALLGFGGGALLARRLRLV
jgi:hypothetical protein